MNVLTIRSDTISENVTKLKTEITKVHKRRGQELPTESRRSFHFSLPTHALIN